MGWGVTNEKGWRKGPWTPEEDKLLSDYISLHGDGRWTSVARFAGLNRSGKSCRLRWVNYLRPAIKRGHLTPQEEGIIIELHALWGNNAQHAKENVQNATGVLFFLFSCIWKVVYYSQMPGRTDNEIKNYWRTHFKKRTKPSQRRERRKFEAFRHKTYQLQEEDDMNKNKTGSDGSTEAEMKNAKLVAEAQGNHQEIVLPKIEYSRSSPSSMGVYKYYEDAASWSDNISDDDLWGGLWSLDELVTCMNV